MVFGPAGGRSNDMVGEYFGQNHQQASGFYSHYHPQYLMLMQQHQNNHNFYGFSNSTAQILGSEASLSSVAERRDEAMSSDPPDAIPPPFIDFLGVGATWSKLEPNKKLQPSPEAPQYGCGPTLLRSHSR